MLRDKDRFLETIVLPLVVGALSALMIFPNLDRSYLWQDEAQHALLARTILHHGVPMGRDGLNSLSQEQGTDIAPDGTFRYHPWLPFYVCAAAFAAFGESTWIARFPFALIGLAAIVATYYFARSVWRDRHIAFTAAMLLAFSVPYLLLVRQCRYYSMLSLFMVLGVWAYVEIVRGKKWAPYVLAAAATLLMHTLHLFAAVLLAACCVHMLIWERRLWKQVLIPAAAVGAVHVPWLMWMSAGAKYHRQTTFEGLLDFLVWYVWRLLLHVVTPVVPIAYYILRRVRKGRSEEAVPLERDQRALVLLCLLTCAIGLVMLTLLSPGKFFRYLSPFFPIAALLGAPVVVQLTRTRRELGAICAIALAGWYVFPMALSQYGIELTQPHRGPIRGIVEYLRTNAKPDDTVFLPYGDMPVKFYTPLRIYGAGLKEESLPVAANATWCIPRTRVPFAGELKDGIDAVFQAVAASGKYDLIELECPDTQFENREDIAIHQFGPPKDVPQVRIFHRARP